MRIFIKLSTLNKKKFYHFPKFEKFITIFLSKLYIPTHAPEFESNYINKYVGNKIIDTTYLLYVKNT